MCLQYIINSTRKLTKYFVRKTDGDKYSSSSAANCNDANSL